MSPELPDWVLFFGTDNIPLPARTSSIKKHIYNCNTKNFEINSWATFVHAHSNYYKLPSHAIILQAEVEAINQGARFILEIIKSTHTNLW